MFQNIWVKLASASDVINSSASQACGSSCNTNTSISGIFSGITNALIFLIGALSVIMIIVGALRYVTSNGDSKQLESAKMTIMYSVAGLVVAIASFAIVKFVITNIK